MSLKASTKNKKGDIMENKTLEEVKKGIQKRMNVATEKLLEIIDKNYEAILTEEDDHVVEWFRYDLEDWIGEKELIALLKQGAEIKNLEMKKSREELIKELIKWLHKDNFSADSLGEILHNIWSKNKDSFSWNYFHKVTVNGKSDDKVLIKVIADEDMVFDAVSFFKYEIDHPCFIENNEEIKKYIEWTKEAYNEWCEKNEKTPNEELEKRVEDWANEWDCRAYLAREFRTPVVIIEFDGDNPKAARTEVEHQLSTVHVAEDSDGNLQVDAEEFKQFLNQNE